MNEPERFQPGELLAASRLNDALDYSRGQYAQVPGTDFDVFGGQNANARSQKRFERIMLVRAREDFEVRITNCSVADGIPAGRVDLPRIIPQVNAYEVPTSLRPDWVYDPVAGLSGGSTKKEGDYFHVVFNEDSGRWEVLNGGAGTHEILFSIDEVHCPDEYDDEWYLTVTPIWYTGSCTGSPPGVDQYTGKIRVYDPLEIHTFYSADDLPGTKGRATYMFPLDGYCSPQWNLDSLNAQPEC